VFGLIWMIRWLWLVSEMSAVIPPVGEAA